MRGVIYHVSYPKRSAACTNALKNIPRNRGLAPSCPKILDNRAYFFSTFLSLPTTGDQSFSEVVSILSRHLNDFTKVSGRL